MKEVNMGMGREEVRFKEEGREWILSSLLYADDLVLWGESEEELRAMVDVLLRCVEEVWNSMQVRSR